MHSQALAMVHNLGVVAAAQGAMEQTKLLLVLEPTAVSGITRSQLGPRRPQRATLVIFLVVAQAEEPQVMEPLAWAAAGLWKPTAQQTQEAALVVTMGHCVLAALAS